MRRSELGLWLGLASAACTGAPAMQAPAGQTAMSAAGSAAGVAAPGSGSAGAAGAGGRDAGVGSTGTPQAGASAGRPGLAGAAVPSAGASAGSSAPADAGPGDASVGDASIADAASGDAAAGDGMNAFAEKLNALFIDVPCTANTPTPLAQGATCQHPPNTQHIERMLTFGGTAGTVYKVTLRVRGIWEPTSIKGGTRPLGKTPFTLGGTVATGTGDPINYQQYFITVSEPKQTYWLNDYMYVAHDIHKEDYQASIEVAGGATVVVTMNDGNDHEIANWTKDFFQGLPPYDKAPSTGQLLRLDVVSVAVR